MKKKALLFGGTDGHGLIMTVLSERNLIAEGYEVQTVCIYEGRRPGSDGMETSAYSGTNIPCFFWQYTFPNYTREADRYDLVVIVDIPIPEPDSRCPTRIHEFILDQIEVLTRQNIRVLLIDHHKASFTHYGEVIRRGAEVIIASSALFTHYGRPDSYSFRWGRVGAICDRDDGVFPIDDDDPDLDLAARVDKAKIRLSETLEAVRRDNREYFYAFSPDIPPVENAEVYDEFVFIPRLENNVGFKQLEAACKQYNKDYGVGISYKTSDKPVILLATYWRSGKLPIALRLGLTRFRGHAAALNVDYSPETLEQIFSILSRKTTGNSGHWLSREGCDNFYDYVSRFLQKVEIPYFMTLHGWGHVEHVIAYGRSLGSLCGLSLHDQKILEWACLLHDIGYGYGYDVGERSVLSDEEIHDHHHEYSYEMIHAWDARGLFEGFLSHDEVRLVADLCLRHRKKCRLPPTEKELLYVLLKVADAMDNDKKRAQKNDEGKFYDNIKEGMSEASRREWEAHQAVEGLVLHASATAMRFRVVVNDPIKAQPKINDISLEIQPLLKFFSVHVEWCDICDQQVQV